VDDSPSVRALLAARLREQGHEIEEAADGESGAEKAVTAPPDAVVTDLHMQGISGVQLCRILRAEPSTAHVPVVLLTASGDKRSRFWARSAGAAAYVGKERMDELVTLIPELVATSKANQPSVWPDRGSAARRTLQERMSSILDTALFESVISGEVRALAASGEHTRLFEGLVTLLADVLTYQWLALVPQRQYTPIYVHANVEERDRVEPHLRATVRAAPADRNLYVIADDRAVARGGGSVETWTIAFAQHPIGTLAVAPTARGLSRDDRKMLALVASELAGPLQMCALYEDAQRMATTDALTGLLNRRAFLDAVERERARSDRHVLPFSLLLLDLDHFKAVNDTNGHAAGDAVLKGVANVLTRVARKSDVVARWGGEEFVVALPQTGEAGARVAGERVRRGIAEATYALPSGEALRMTASVGVSSAESPWALESIVGAADAAMYSAKSRGRNRVEALPADALPLSARKQRALR
jgi:two-component system cell cycle response regulator